MSSGNPSPTPLPEAGGLLAGSCLGRMCTELMHVYVGVQRQASKALFRGRRSPRRERRGSDGCPSPVPVRGMPASQIPLKASAALFPN